MYQKKYIYKKNCPRINTSLMLTQNHLSKPSHGVFIPSPVREGSTFSVIKRVKFF